MAIFFYRAYGQSGELAKGQIEAVSEQAAKEMLWADKLVPFELVPADRAEKSWWERASGGRPSASQMAVFTREFATLISAGIPLDEALRVVSDETASAKTRLLANAMLVEVLKGGALSDAIEKQRASFPTEYASVVRAGEVGGKLGQALEELATLLESRNEIRGKVQSALVYPVVLCILSLAALAIIVGVLIPNIAPIFTEGSRPVPGEIRILMALHAHWPEILIVLAVIVAGIIGLVLTMLRDPAKRLVCDRFVLGIPGLGPFLLRQETARYARTLGTLLKAGVPLLQAAMSARTTLRNIALANATTVAIEAIREGAPLHFALRSHTMLPASALRMIAIGEETARLDGMLLRVAEMFEAQSARETERFITIFTPALTLIVASFIGALIITIMNAILSLNDLAVQ